jgi:hypothetical protein
MKYIAKMMLALVASVTLVIPAYAWDFSASGSAAAYFNQTTTKADKDTDSYTSMPVTSEMSSLKLSSSHTDGDHSAAFSYKADWDGNMDQLINVTGSKKAGKWTASASVEYNLNEPGCYASDNGTGDTTAVTKCNLGGQTGEDRGSITVTDGTMTIVFGESGHLANTAKTTDTTAADELEMDSSDDDIKIGAFVDSFHGVSVGYKVSDMLTATVALQYSTDQSDLLGTEEFRDGEVTTGNAKFGTSGAGVSIAAVAGPATIGVTVGSAKSKDVGIGKLTAATELSVMGVGIGVDLGDIDVAVDYGSNTSKTTDASEETKTGGFAASATYALGSDKVIFYTGTLEEQTSKADSATKTTGLGLGYTTTVGPTALAVGYAKKAISDSDGTTDSDGYSLTDLEVKMTFSF